MSDPNKSGRGVGVRRAATIVAVWLLVLGVAGCGQAVGPVAATPGRVVGPAPASTPTPAALAPGPAPAAGLAPDQVATLESLERLDEYPLYTMRYQGAYNQGSANLNERVESVSGVTPAWGCSLLAALGDPEGMLYGRNFDWEFSPALLLFMDPPDGYASVSMVDIAYLGFDDGQVGSLDTLPLDQRADLLDAPLIPFDGMNEYGLVVGMAAVPAGNVAPDPQRPTIGSLGVIREMLDHARTADEALAIVEGYNVDMAGGPPVHYLVADGTGRALLIEFYHGALRVLPNEAPWHLATNFLRASVAGDAAGQCWRYDTVAERLRGANGRLDVPQAMALLSSVSQPGTQWSVVYGLQSGQIDVAMGRQYDATHTLTLDMAAEPAVGARESGGPGVLSGSGDVARDVLTRDELMNGLGVTPPVDEAALALPQEAAMAQHAFEGRLELVGEETAGEMEVLRGELEPEAAHLPPFDFDLVQAGSYLVPVRRGLVIADDPEWNYIVEPGRAWRETGDGGMSRASVPFTLVSKGYNASLNGTMTFLFDDEQVSHAWYQVTQEVTSYTRANLWGMLHAAYHPGPVAGAGQVRAAIAQEMAGRMPSRPIEQLAQDYPGVDVSAFGRGLSPEHVTWYGVVVDGVNYVGGCHTRWGRYAYCESMRATSYSTAKSTFPSLALMRLAQKYGPGVADLLVKDYVAEYVDSPGDWSRVTLNNTLDMATGNYASSGSMVDEDGPTMGEFFAARPYERRIVAAFAWPHAAPPGKQWVYHTGDTFIATRAMQVYLQSREGPEADIFRFVVDEVYRPLGIGPGALSTNRTADDNWQGQPEGGSGLWWIPDDVAKLAMLLNVDGGAIDGVQVLHPDLLAAAMQRDPDDRGVDIDRRRKYNNAFWAQQYGPAQGFDCEFWVPHMLGVSGNAVVLMPNGVTYYYFSDNREFAWDAAVREADKIAPLCPSGD